MDSIQESRADRLAHTIAWAHSTENRNVSIAKDDLLWLAEVVRQLQLVTNELEKTCHGVGLISETAWTTIDRAKEVLHE